MNMWLHKTLHHLPLDSLSSRHRPGLEGCRGRIADTTWKEHCSLEHQALNGLNNEIQTDCSIQLKERYSCNSNWPTWMSPRAGITPSTRPFTVTDWILLPSRRSHRVITSSKMDNRKGSKAATTEPETFHLLPAWWLLSFSKLRVVKPGKNKARCKDTCINPKQTMLFSDYQPVLLEFQRRLLALRSKATLPRTPPAICSSSLALPSIMFMLKIRSSSSQNIPPLSQSR